MRHIRRIGPATPPRDRISCLTGSQLCLCLLALGWLWPAVLNGGAFFFPDSSTYIRGVDAAVFRATGHRTAWTDEGVERLANPSPAPVSVTPRRDGVAAAAAKPVLLGRSAYYGVLPYAGALVGSFWPTIVLQALLAGAALVGATRLLVDPAAPRRFAVAVAVAVAVVAVTPLPFFVSMLMPDFLTGVAVLAAAALLLGWSRERWSGRTGWLVLASYATLAHASHVLILIALGGIGAIAAALRRNRDLGRGAAAVLLAAGIGLAGEAAFAHVVATMTGRPAIRPPFLTARWQEDGPATAFLRERCGTNGWVLCRYRDRLPVGSDSFLWSADPRTGVFSAVDTDEQRRLAAEQGRFVGAVFADRPVAVIGSSLRSAGVQFGQNGLSEFDMGPQDFRNIAEQLPAAERPAFLRSGAVRHGLPTRTIAAVSLTMLLLSLPAIAMAWLTAGQRRAAAFGSVVVAGWAVNNLVTGALSTPHDRYQARIVWTVIAAAVLLLMAQRRASPPRHRSGVDPAP